MGNDAQIFQEGTAAFFILGDFREGCCGYPGWELSSEPLSLAGNELQPRLLNVSGLAGMTSWGMTMGKGTEASIRFLPFCISTERFPGPDVNGIRSG